MAFPQAPRTSDNDSKYENLLRSYTSCENFQLFHFEDFYIKKVEQNKLNNFPANIVWLLLRIQSCLCFKVALYSHSARSPDSKKRQKL